MDSIITKLTRHTEMEPVVTCNLSLPELEKINQYITAPHGASLVALTSIDPKNKNLDLSIEFDYHSDMERFVGHILDIWGKYKPIPSVIRSYKQDGKFVDYIDDAKMEHTDHHPESMAEYNNKHVLIDIDVKQDNDYTFKLHRWRDSKARIITCRLKQQTNDIQSAVEEFQQQVESSS